MNKPNAPKQRKKNRQKATISQNNAKPQKTERGGSPAAGSEGSKINRGIILKKPPTPSYRAHQLRRNVPEQRHEPNDMTAQEAKAAIETLKTHTCSIMEICYQLEHRKGFQALGYDSFKKCIQAELAGIIGYDYAHKMKEAAKTHLLVCPEIPLGNIVESVFRPLHKLSDPIKKNVWESALAHCGDAHHITAPMLIGIIAEQSLASPASSGEHDEAIKIHAELSHHVNEVVWNQMKNYHLANGGHQPVSKAQYGKAVNQLLADLRTYLMDHYSHLSLDD